MVANTFMFGTSLIFVGILFPAIMPLFELHLSETRFLLVHIRVFGGAKLRFIVFTNCEAACWIVGSFSTTAVYARVHARVAY
jgi:hypothetical protein